MYAIKFEIVNAVINFFIKFYIYSIIKYTRIIKALILIIIIQL